MDMATLTEATFALLPSELLNVIGDFLENIHELSNLARINQKFYRVFNRLLYEAAVKDHHPGPTIEAASSGNLGALKIAAEHGANLDYHQVKPLTADEIAAKGIRYPLSPRARWGAPLHFAIIYGHQDVVEWLISKGVDIEAPARLYCGCENPNDIVDYYRIFREHYDNGVMVWTLLHYAICHGQIDIAHLLLSAGSSPLCTILPRPESWPPGLEMLEELYSHHPTRIRHRRVDGFYHDETCALYWGRNVSITALDTAVALGNKSIVTRLLKDIGMDPNCLRGALDNSVFQYAATCGDESLVDHLVLLGADSRLLLKADWSYTKFPIYIAFRMHHPSAAFKLVECGTPIWSNQEVWDYETDTSEQVEKPISLLTVVLAGWDDEWSRTNTRLCGLTDKCCDHDEHDIAAKKKAFLKLAQRTVDEVPHEVSTNELKAILARGLIAMFDHADFCDEDFSEYVKIVKPALGEDAIDEFRQSTLSLLVNHETRGYEFAQMHAITFLLDDRWFDEPITHIDETLMKIALKTVVRTIPWLEDDGYAILTNPDRLIRTLELLRVHGAWKDAREQPEGLSTEEKGPWSLAGTIVKGKKCSELSGKWKKIASDELKIIPSKFRHMFTRIRWES
ncbi:ankyrin-like protein [Colletotrichum kahawae]|uniref:Ankyrin-like protein n=1 Tax=Colletotrichum kahawae TaxID=34407 RepID=A0AAE0DCN0_COLKA|nr:ankyrin-like protein [Colletotrichum kahawae]